MGQAPVAHSHGGTPHIHAVGQHSRRRFLTNALGVVGVAWLPGLGLAACTPPQPGAPTPAGSTPPPPGGGSTATATRVLYRNGALADARSATLQRNVSLFVEGGRISWIRPKDGEEDLGNASDVWVVDCYGSTIVPGLVDAHSHTAMFGGIEYFNSGAKASVEAQLRQGEENARLLTAAGVRYIRDVGSPRIKDPDSGKDRAASLVLRDRWKGKPGYPIMQAAGTWLDKQGSPTPPNLTLKVASPAELLTAAQAQLDEGADLIKLYLETAADSPWTAAEMKPVVDLAHQRNAKVAAHSAAADPIKQAVLAGVDSIEHGWLMEPDVAKTAAEQGVAFVPTMAAVLAQDRAGKVAPDSPFAGGVAKELLAQLSTTVKEAAKAGVSIVTGSDFGGSPLHAGLLYEEIELLVAAGLQPWEALAAATWRAGELMGIPEAGTLKEGGPADLIVVEGDPLSDPPAMSRVWHVSWRV